MKVMLSMQSFQYLLFLFILNYIIFGIGLSNTLIKAGPKFKVYDPDARSLFYMNDHTFILGTNWNIIGISHTNPADPSYEVNLAHATTNTTILHNDSQIFQQQPFVLGAIYPETHLWAPHILDITNYNYTCNNEINAENNKHCYIMVYCGGGYNRSESLISAAYSTDLYEWKRMGILFIDGVDARDPMLFYDNNTLLWHLYYTATRPNNENIGNVSHVVLLRQSNNLFDINSWNKTAQIVFNCGYSGQNYGGSCESPFVIKRGYNYYLFTGPWYNYTTTRSFYSNNSYYFGSVTDNSHQQIAIFGDMHAAEVVRDTNAKWYLSGAGWSQGGVYLRELYFYDNFDNESTSMNTPIPIKIPQKYEFNTNLEFIDMKTDENDEVIYNESMYWNLLPSFSNNLFAGNPMNNSFFITNNLSQNIVDNNGYWQCKIIFKLISSDGNPTSGQSPITRDGSAIAIIFGVDDNNNNLKVWNSAFGINMFLDHGLSKGGGLKFFKFNPYKQYFLVDNNNISNDIWYEIQLKFYDNYKYLT
eukprot:425395_1